MEVKSELQKLEDELITIFKEYKKLGKYHYSAELKRKVFNAYSQNIKPDRIVKLCNISLATAINWLHIYRGRRDFSDQSTTSRFREITIYPIAQEKNCPPMQENLSAISNRKTDLLKIKFPNGIELKCKTSDSNTLVQFLFYIKQ